jgi:nucleoside-diphosphate-sugar epimerase
LEDTVTTERVERALVSGATGFVGRALVAHLEAAATRLRFGEDDWLEQVQSADFRGATVFHLAARVHEENPGADESFIRDNVEKTRALANAAARGGARRLVFLSSVKVNGEETKQRPFRPGDAPAPEDAYGRSKAQAEQALREVKGLEIAIVRAPLVYGAGVKGNLLHLLRLADSPWPLPFGAIRNRRSFVHVDDLARLLIDCALQPRAAGGTFFAAHWDTVSTPQLITSIRTQLGRPARLPRVAPGLIEAAAAIAGQRRRVRRLTRSLEVDVSDTTTQLGWAAQIGVVTAIEDMVSAYREAAP